MSVSAAFEKPPLVRTTSTDVRVRPGRRAELIAGVRAPADGASPRESADMIRTSRSDRPSACGTWSTACRTRRGSRCSTGMRPLRPHHRRRLQRPQRRRVPDAGRAPLRRPHRLPQLRPRLGPLHRRRQPRAHGERARAAHAARRSSRRASGARRSCAPRWRRSRRTRHRRMAPQRRAGRGAGHAGRRRHGPPG